MTHVGHTLTGIAIGATCLPEGKSAKWKTIHLVVFALLANVPDFRFQYWGHHRYFISHSLFVNLSLILFILAAFISIKPLTAKVGGWQVVLGGVFAWLSHLLLDTFYNHGQGLPMFWPFSDASLALPIPLFSVVKTPPPPLTTETLQIYTIEFFFYGAVLLLVLGLKRRWISPRLRA